MRITTTYLLVKLVVNLVVKIVVKLVVNLAVNLAVNLVVNLVVKLGVNRPLHSTSDAHARTLPATEVLLVLQAQRFC
jgi:hypothetical protein